MSTPTVVKANALIEAGHRLSISEQRVVISAITQIDRTSAPDSRRWYSVEAGALADVAGIEASDAYDDLAVAAERLWDKEIVIREGPNGEPLPAQGSTPPRVLKTRWVQAIQYVPGEGRVELMFAEPITPYLVELRERFTTYQLRYVAPMKSRFGPRLYELLAQWRQAGSREVPLDWLQDIWGTSYSRTYEFKRKAIEPAVRDVNTHSDLSVEVGYRKTGRRVTHAQFRFQPKQKQQGQKKGKKGAQERRIDGIPVSEIEAAMRPGETFGAARERLAAARRR